MLVIGLLAGRNAEKERRRSRKTDRQRKEYAARVQELTDDLAVAHESLQREVAERNEIAARLAQTNNDIVAIANQINDITNAVATARGAGGDAVFLRFENKTLIRCHQVKNCNKTDCPAYRLECVRIRPVFANVCSISWTRPSN